MPTQLHCFHHPLFHQQDGDVGVAMNIPDALENLLDDGGMASAGTTTRSKRYTRCILSKG